MFDWSLEYIQEYFSDNPALIAICKAIEDKQNGLGLIYQMTDFTSLFGELEHYPSNYVIGQARDYLKALLDSLENEGKIKIYTTKISENLYRASTGTLWNVAFDKDKEKAVKKLIKKMKDEDEGR